MKEKIIEILVSELGYPDYVADLTAGDLLLISPQLQPTLNRWLDTREITDIEVSGFSIRQLMEERQYTFPSAIISLDWLQTEPEIAFKELSEEVRR